jgi:hypothetical protein
VAHSALPLVLVLTILTSKKFGPVSSASSSCANVTAGIANTAANDTATAMLPYLLIVINLPLGFSFFLDPKYGPADQSLVEKIDISTSKREKVEYLLLSKAIE